MYSTQITVPPALEPVSLVEAKAHLHYDAADQDARIAALITAAREACEVETNRAFMTKTVCLAMDCFPGSRGAIYLPFPPLQAVLSVAYTDTAGNAQALAAENYQADAISEPGRLAPARGIVWPETDCETLGAVLVSYRAGWTSASNVPAEIKQAILLLVGHWFEQLSPVITGSIQAELPFTVKMLLTHQKMPFLA